MSYETVYDDDGKSEVIYIKEEPDCPTCCDTGVIRVSPRIGEIVERDCPECCPSPEEIAAATAEYERAVAAGEVNPDAAPF